MKKLCVILSIAAVIAVVCLAGCANRPPVINSLSPFPAEDTLASPGDTVEIICSAEDPDLKGPEIIVGTGGLDYTWEAPDGGNLFEVPNSFLNENKRYWAAPEKVGDYRIICTVADEHDATDSDTLTIEVVVE